MSLIFLGVFYLLYVFLGKISFFFLLFLCIFKGKSSTVRFPAVKAGSCLKVLISQNVNRLFDNADTRTQEIKALCYSASEI